jgi:hypothetical protein
MVEVNLIPIGFLLKFGDISQQTTNLPSKQHLEIV